MIPVLKLCYVPLRAVFLGKLLMNVRNIHTHDSIHLIDVRYNDVHNTQVVSILLNTCDLFRVVFAGATIVISDGKQVMYCIFVFTYKK